MKKIYQPLLLSCLALVALKAGGQTIGSYIGKNIPLYEQGGAGGKTDEAPKAATLDFKVVTINGKTWAQTIITNGIIDGYDAWVSQLRFWNSSNAGKRENSLTIRPNATESLGSITAAPDADGKISIFQNLQAIGFSETALFDYNPAVANTPTPEDGAAPTLTKYEAENVSQVSALLRFEATEDNDYFYHVTGDNGFEEEVAFADSLSLSGLTAGTAYALQVTAVDFSGNKSAQQTISFTTSPSINLSTPTGISIDANGVISFTGDENALKYTVTVYRGTSALVDHAQDVSAAGETLSFGIPGTYAVTVQAIGNGLDIVSSPVSASYTWNLVNDSYTPPTLASSANCRQVLTNTGVDIWLTVEERDGNLWVTLEPSTPGDVESRFRANGFAADNFTLNGKTGAWFTKTENGNRRLVFTPTIPLHAGDEINYNGAIEWVVPGNDNAYELGFTLEKIGGSYVWGSRCPRLPAPADIAIDDDRTLTFTGDESVARYAIKIYNDAGVLACSQDVSSGDVLPFDVPGAFTVVMQSLAAAGDKDHLDSDTSLHYTWNLVNTGRITYLSEFLNTEVGTGNGRALWTWETVDTVVVVSIGAIEGKDPSLFNFRNTEGLNPQLFTVNGVPNTGEQFFTVTYTNTAITLTPVAGAVKLGDVVSYSGMVTYRTADDANLWPTIDFGSYGLFVYGAKGFTLFPPENISVSDSRVLSFDGDDEADSYAVKIYNEAGLQVAAQTVAASGETLIYDVPGSYTVKLQSLAASPERRNSIISEPYAWIYAGEGEVRYPSTFCGFTVNPVGRDDNDKAVFTWETRDGKLVVTISDADGNFDTYFRNKGLQITDENSFKVNGVPGDWFNDGVPSGDVGGYKVITYEPKEALKPGDQVTFNGIVEYRTGLQVIDGVPEGLWPTIDFGAFAAFTWGTTCDYYPQVNVSVSRLTFSPDTGIQRFELSADKLTMPLAIEASKGLQVSPTAVAPNAEGKVHPTVVNVTWEEGSSSGFVRVSGGGLAFPKEIPVVSHRFSEYCNKVLYPQAGDAPIYLTIAENGDKTELSFTLAPVYGASAQWNNINAMTSSGSQALSTKTGNGTTTVTATFDAPLEEGDVVTFGSPVVWTADRADGTTNNNAYIDAPQTYTVGAGGCALTTPHPAVYPAIASAAVHSRADASATLKIAANESDATYTVEAVRLREANGLLPMQVLELAADSLYTLEELKPAATYSLELWAIDAKGYASAPQTLTFTTRDVLVADSFEHDVLENIAYDGAEHPVTVAAKAGIAAGIGSMVVKYNGLDAAPVSAGNYAVTLEVAQGEDFMAATFELGSFAITKAAVLADSLAYDTTAVTYDGATHALAVAAKPGVAGLGDITAVKYNGVADIPVSAGSYVVTADVAEGDNYQAAVGLRLGTLLIGKAAAISADSFSINPSQATYSGASQPVEVSVKPGVRGLGSITSILYNGSEVAPLNAGRYGVTLNLAEGDNYLAGVVELPDSFEVAKAALTAEHLRYTPKNVQYDGNPHEVAVSLVDTYTGLGEVTVKYYNSVGDEAAPAQAGEYTVKVSVAEGDNFSATAAEVELGQLVISSKALVTLAELDYALADATYDGAPHAVVVTAKVGVVGLGAITVKYNGSEVAPVDTGAYSVTVDVAEGDSYQAAADLLLGTLIISKAAIAKLPVTLAELDYAIADVTYDGVPHAVVVTAKPGVVGLGAITVKYNGSEAAPVDTGAYSVTVSVAEGDSYQAAADLLLGTLIISKTAIAKLPVTLAELDYALADVTYDGVPHAVVVTAKPGVVGLGAITVKYNGSEATPVDTGAYSVTVDVAEGDSYLAALELALGQLVIRAAPVAEPPTAVEASPATTFSAFIANGVLYVAGEVESVSVISTGGSLALSARAANGSALSVAHLPAGVYVVAMQGKGKTCVVKLHKLP
ncbi:MAG: MBG domain-containing protein [Prevotellaceae bacterium]|jgi:hypothetical protein|nr:MBG domain-containing protein [Prevotellaceae bacterium]